MVLLSPVFEHRHHAFAPNLKEYMADCWCSLAKEAVTNPDAIIVTDTCRERIHSRDEQSLFRVSSL